MATKKNHPRKRRTSGASQKAKSRSSGAKKWSAGVTKHSNALDLEKGVFTSGSPEKIADSLERSARQSKRKKGSSYQSAMSMLNFYINRAGKNLPASKKKVLTKAKEKLKEKHEKETTHQ